MLPAYQRPTLRLTASVTWLRVKNFLRTAGGIIVATRAEIARSTGLRRDVVDAAVDRLVRLGKLRAEELSTGCPSGGCGNCTSGVDGAPGCGVAAPSMPGPRRRGPVLVQLSLRR